MPITAQNMGLTRQMLKEKNPCALCSKMRRGALNQAILDRGIRKLALGHHRDDVMETYLMSTVFEGRFYAMQPIRQMEKGNICVIRPLIDVKEGSIAALSGRLQFPVVKNPCPVDGLTKRQEMKETLRALESRFPGALDHFQSALEKERK